MFVRAGKCLLRMEDIKNIVYNNAEQGYNIFCYDPVTNGMFLPTKEGEELIADLLYIGQRIACS